MLCDHDQRMKVHLLFAECYYGSNSEEAAEEKDPNLNSNETLSDNSTIKAEVNGTFVLQRLPDADNAVILDLHKDFDGFYLELDCILRTMHIKALEP